LASYRAAGYRIVFTNGCFDILHAGHISYLNRARTLGDILIIGVNSDASVSRLKGPSRPINPVLDRIQVLAALSCVDCLISFEEDTPINLIRLVRPDVYVKGGDYTKETLPEALIVEELGGRVEILPFIENRSTTTIIKRVCQAELKTQDI
jgi:D-beta-D-heptose 7-phosphate kinase/D-beta-D-heptose 1-phosphate adenosyltransferase